jgi:hypothetical protein
MRLKSNRIVAGSLLLSLGLAACGGGGGGDSAPSGVSVPTAVRSGSASASSDLTAANASGFAGSMARAVMSGADGSVPGVSAGRESPLTRGGSGVLSQGRLAFVFGSAARAAAGNGREQAQATSTQTVACPLGGSMTITLNDADGNQKLSAGDSANIQFNACVAEAGKPAATGTLAFTLNAVELDAQQEPSALDASITLTAFAENGFGSMSGSFRVWFKQESSTSTRERISYLGTAVAESGQTLAYSFDVYGASTSSGSGSFDINGAVTVGGQTYAVTSTVFGHGNGTLPDVGALTIRDAAGDAVIVRARSTTTFDLEFQPVGAAAPTVLAGGLLWSNYRLAN